MIDTQNLYKKYLDSSGVSTDTRKIAPDTIFFALTGEHFDGNNFAAQALEAGAKYVVVDKARVIENDRFLLVADVLAALQALATYHRQTLGIPVIGLTGSNGKTTTKELIREVLSTKYNVCATEGNFNNHLGVPLTLLRMTESTELGVVEMGANHIGEIAALCEITQPSHGLITNIGKAHIEGFGSYEGVIRAKSELYHYLIQHDGVVFINSNDPLLTNMSKRMAEPIFYNSKGDFYECKLITANPYVELATENCEHVQTKLIGTYNFKNIAAALCIGKYFEVSEHCANEAIASFVPENNRSQIINTASNRIILDAYNANPVSMKAALENIDAMDHPNKVVILGDMFELGADTGIEHELVVDQVKQIKPARALFCGTESIKAAHKIDVTGKDKAMSTFDTKDKLVKYLEENPIKNSLILIKASRGMGLETLVDYL
jgi:UDP-N-acetylmuramoyl-tripeptide--D-alanyl-D-alanine ligase